MTMQVISAVAEFEKDLLIERTHSGIALARVSGKRFGRPPSLNGEQQQVVLERLNAGASTLLVYLLIGYVLKDKPKNKRHYCYPL